MQKILFATLFSFMLLFTITSQAEKRRVLFIGNSYIYVNDLPLTLQTLALSFGDSIEYESNAIGGATLQMHTTNATTIAKLLAPGWDYVIIQAQSQEPSFSPSQVSANTYPYAQILDSLAHAGNPCVETMFFMTWGRKNGDASNCAAYPPVCTFEGMQQRLRESYLEMTMMNNATCAPVGAAWKYLINNFSGINLYQADESHPSIHGTYLTACVFYSSIFHKESNGSPAWPIGILTWEGLTLQNAASRVVLDSLETWQQYGSIPSAKYTETHTGNTYNFTNASLRSTNYAWDFGDGSPINNATSPTHTYAASGTYTVKLKAMNTCGKYDIFLDTMYVNTFPNAVSSFETNDSFTSNYNNGYVHIFSSIQLQNIQVYNVQGALVKQGKLQDQKLYVGDLAKGMYFMQAHDGKRWLHGSLVVN